MMRTPSESRASGKGTVSSAHFSAEFISILPRERPSLYLTILDQSHEGQRRSLGGRHREGSYPPQVEELVETRLWSMRKEGGVETHPTEHLL